MPDIRDFSEGEDLGVNVNKDANKDVYEGAGGPGDGTDPGPARDALEHPADVAVVGGGAAGLSGALMLARSLRDVVVIDSGEPRNAPADAVHGLLAHDGLPPRELLRRGRAEISGYGGRFVDGEVVGAAREGALFRLRLADGRTLRAGRLLVTTGLRDLLPDVEGLAAHWGSGVVHCPYCHGYELRGKVVGVLGTGAKSVHQALLFRQLTPHVVYFTHRTPLEAEEYERIVARGITVVEGEVASVAPGPRLEGLRLADGTTVPVEAVAVATRTEPRGNFLAELGLPLEEMPGGGGVRVVAGVAGTTEVPGVWAAGNVTEPFAQVGAASAAGALAGAHINADLVGQEADEAVAARRASP